MKKAIKIFLFILLIIPVCAKAEAFPITSDILLKALLSTGGDLRLDADITVSENLSVNNETTLDLNGHTIDLTSKTIVPYGTLTIKDSSSDQSGKITGTGSFLFQVGTSANPGGLIIDGGTIECKGSYGIRNYGNLVMNGGTITGKSFVVYNQTGSFEMNGGSIISSTGVAYYGGENTPFVMNDGLIELTGDNYAVSLSKPGATATINNGTIRAMYSNAAGTAGGNAIGAFKDTELTINGGTISAYGNTIMGNGSDSGSNEGTNAKFNINGGSINSTVGAAIYAPQVNGLTTITGGTLTGKTGIEIRAGKLVISGGTINADTENYQVNSNANGLTTNGTAISVAQHTTKQPIEVVITGGEFNASTPFSETNPLNNSDTDIDKISLDISGGVFNASSDTTVTIIRDDKFISGGDFSNNVTEYVVDGYGEKDLTSDSVRVLPYRGVEVTEDTDFDVVGIDTAFPTDEIEVKPKYKKGYEVDEIIVIDENGNIIPVINNKFIMPNGKVTIQVKYRYINNPQTGDNILLYLLILIAAFSIKKVKKCIN